MKIKTIALLVLGIAIFTSCDKNISKIKEIAENFATSVNNNDKISAYDIYPHCRTYNHMNLADSMCTEDIDVEFNKEDSTYLAKYSDNQYLVFKVNGENAEIIDSYGILSIDSVCYELAAQLGVPVKEKSDLYNAKLFNKDDSRFLNWLEDEYKNATNGNLEFSKGTYTTWAEGWIIVNQKITNKGRKLISGNEYAIEFSFESKHNENQKAFHIEQGVNLLPGESHVFSFYQALSWDVKWNKKVILKVPTPFEALLKYGEFKGNEYERFLNRAAMPILDGHFVEFYSKLAKRNKNKKKYSNDKEDHARTLDYVTNIPDFENLTHGAVVDSVDTYNKYVNYLGFKRYDIILEINGRKHQTADDFYEVEKNLRKGDKLTYKILRQGKTIELVFDATNIGDTTTTKTNDKYVTEL